MTGLSWVYATLPTFRPLNVQYTYSATANKGQITQMRDNISGETVSYSYDALKRLISASSTPISGSVPTAWTQAFGYDGFGNMTLKTLSIGGGSPGANSAPVVDPTTNRLTSGYDANGNMLTGYGLTMTYDGRNRVASASQMGGMEYYGYAPDNKRIYRWNAAAGTEEFTLYGAQGERLGTFAWATPGSPQYGFVPTETNVWFGKKLINRWVVYGGVGPLPVMRDRLGTDRETGARYYPYGDEITSTANGAEKYGTYFRDSFTALDYADQRYYVGAYGRFNTADPMAASAIASNPGSWNRYAYVGGDPINFNDRKGLSRCNPDAVDDGGSDDSCGDDGGGDDGGGDGSGGDGGNGPSLGSNPCTQIYQALLGGTVSCTPPSTVPIVTVGYTPPPAAPPPQCFIEQEYRPVDQSSLLLSQFNHAYFFVGTSTGADLVLEGLPQNNPPVLGEAWGDLEAYVLGVSPSGAVAGDPKDNPLSNQVTGSVTGPQSAICGLVNKLISTTSTFSGPAYDPLGIFGANSNSFAAYLAHLTGQNLGTPPHAPGYNWAILAP